ncbi:MAG: anaerobic glycerol-3-phosphate dehydrogenase subunit GlpB, partial [Bacteroidales bacterium]|nr:anaerobic glycerol-3-phosphate dehydrogenase subunit GlpB [Bacteroidales bacterium]
MKFDIVLIGGGLSSLVCGIKLQKAGKKCLMVSAGQNALHFSSGAFSLLGKLPDGTDVAEPLSAVETLPSEHPYSKIGKQRLSEYVASVPGFFSDCGVALHPVTSASSVTKSSASSVADSTPSVAEPVEAVEATGTIRNGYRITALGTLKPAWLAMDDVTLLASKDEKIGEKALIVNFSGFLDFNTRFIAEGLEKRGTECRIESVKLDEVELLRKNPAEMRSVNIARVMNHESSWKAFAHKVQELLNGEDVVVLPEVFGFEEPVIMQWIKEMIPAKVVFVGTTPPSVPGIRTQRLLKKAFEAAGGTFLMGDEAIDAVFDGERVASIRTANLGELRIEADTFVLA